MNRTQKRLIGVYIPVTVVIILLDLVLGSSPLMWLLKYLVVLSLFLVSLSLPRRTKDQERLRLSLLFVAAGDAFLYLPLSLGHAASPFLPHGMVMFLGAYGCLILVYGQGMGDERDRFPAAIPAFALFFLGLVLLPQGTSRLPRFLVPVFLLVLCTMLWSALCALSKRSILHRKGEVIALSGILMVVCDVGVGLGFSYPHVPGLLHSLAGSVVWAAYLPAWTLILWLVAEEEPLAVPEGVAAGGKGGLEEVGGRGAGEGHATESPEGRSGEAEE